MTNIMKEQIAHIVWNSWVNAKTSEDTAQAIIDALPGMVPPLVWSKPFPPGEHGSRYDHSYAHLEYNTLFIEWKSWKDYASYDCTTPWGHVSENSLEAAQTTVGELYVAQLMKALGVKT